MQFRYMNGLILVKNFKTNEDGDIAHVDAKNLELIEMDDEFAVLGPFTTGDWHLHKLNGIGQVESGIGIENGEFYEV